MPGISFLFKKKFHPARMSNQKRLFVAEQTVTDRERHELERSQEVKKELENKEYEAMQSGGSTDLRDTSLKFMYSQPKSEKEKTGHKCSVSSRSDGNDIVVSGEDAMVKAFKKNLEKLQSGECQDADGNVHDDPLYETTKYSDEERKRKLKQKTDPNFGASAHRSKLEEDAGKRRRLGLTQEEQAERFAFLKNAPMEGTFAKNIEIRHKPFNEVIRNVQCIRCGEWGHQSGDRECALRDANPHDFARRKREDPLTYMQSDDFLLEKQKMILRHAAAAPISSGSSSHGPKASDTVDSVHNSIHKPAEGYGGSRGSGRDANAKHFSLTSLSNTAVKTGVAVNVTATSSGHLRSQSRAPKAEEDSDPESDPERDFISSLTPRERLLLMRKLRLIDDPTAVLPELPISESSRSSDSDVSDDSDTSSLGSDDVLDGSGAVGGTQKKRSKREKSRKEKKHLKSKSKSKKIRKHKKEKKQKSK